MRWGLGPVFFYECLTSSRRWQTYAIRSAGVAALLLSMWTIASSRNAPATGNSQRDYAILGESYFYGLIGVELALVMLAAPAATAGSICVDRARGTLAHMLMTDLSDPEIVLGKLAARLLPVFGLVACSWPVMAICSLLGGIDPIALTLAFAIILAVALLGCTTALALSVWARKSHEVILATYTLFFAGLLLWPIWEGLAHSGVLGTTPDWTLLANPFYVAYAPYSAPNKLGLWDYLLFFVGTLGPSAVLAGLAVLRTRPVACRGKVEKSRGPRVSLSGRVLRWLPGPSLDRNPVLWREWHRSRPSPWMVILMGVLMGTTGVLCVIGAIVMWKEGVSMGPGSGWDTAGVFGYILHIIFGLLMLAAVAPTSMAEERQRGSLDILAATALSTREIVVGKWLGTFRFAAFMAAGPTVLALAMATGESKSSPAFGPGMPPQYYQEISLGVRLSGVGVVAATILAHGALITSIGLALAVWMKRQGRAIAFSVGLFILILVAWPFFASIVFWGNGWRSQNIAALSPVVACVNFLNFFGSRRYAYAEDVLWWTSFWAVEVFTMAIGLLWLTVRTFDRCFDRLPDRPWRLSVRSIVVLTLAAMIGTGSLLASCFAWFEGVTAHDLDGPEALGILAYSFALAIGLVLIALEAAVSARRARVAMADEATNLPARKMALGRWWDAFRLVLLLAIGPAILAAALTTAPWKPYYRARTPNNASGAPITSYELVTEHVPRIGEVEPAYRVVTAGLWVVTILIHGAAAIAAGLALTTIPHWSRRTLALAIGLTVVVVLAPPVILVQFSPDSGLITAMWNFVAASDALLGLLVARVSSTGLEVIGSVIGWDLAIAAMTIGLLWWTIRVWHRHGLDLSKEQPALGSGADEGSSIVETALISE